MEFSESAEHALLRRTAADIARGFGHAYYAEQARSGARTDDLWSAVAERGLLGVHVPEEFGGGGAGITELAIVCEEIAAQGCPLLLILVSAAICAELIKRFGSRDQCAFWLPGLAAGEKMAFAITEPDAGSNSHQISTTAARVGDGYRLRGRKTFISGVDEADQMLVVARSAAGDATTSGGLSVFIVDTDAPQLSATAIPVEISMPERQFEVVFDDVLVADERRLGDEGAGLRMLFFGLNPERITGAALSAGIGRYALARAADYARQRHVWGVPIGSHQGLSHPLAEAKVELELARLMMAKAAWLHDCSEDRDAAGEAANMAKLAAADASMRCLDSAIQTHGGNGLASEYGLADLWGLTRLLRIAPVSREMILNYVAQHSLSLPRSYG